jgi:hypothetical protein
MKYRITQPRQGYVRPVSRRILDEMKRRLTSGPEWATVATVDAVKFDRRAPLNKLVVYLHEATPDASRHPQLVIVERHNPTPV